MKKKSLSLVDKQLPWETTAVSTILRRPSGHLDILRNGVHGNGCEATRIVGRDLKSPPLFKVYFKKTPRGQTMAFVPQPSPLS